MEMRRWAYRLPETKLGAKNFLHTADGVHEHSLRVGADPLQCLHAHFQKTSSTTGKKKKKEKEKTILIKEI